MGYDGGENAPFQASLVPDSCFKLRSFLDDVVSPQASDKAQCRCTNTLATGLVCHSYEMMMDLQHQSCKSEFATKKVIRMSVSAIDHTPLIFHLIN